MSERWILLDLDGTLLDVARRYHGLHCKQVRGHGGEPLSAARYWELKRARTPEAEILALAGLSAAAAAEVLAARGRGLESSQALRLDRLWPWTMTALDALSRLAPLALVTLRAHRDRLLTQLDALGIAGSFARVVSAAGDGTPDVKAHLVRAAGLDPGPGSVLVGDTEVDIASGRALGVRTIAVSSGLRNADLLAASAPDLLLADLAGVARVLEEIGDGLTWLPCPAPAG
jgi:phosphoglycolate phosphatase